jgi:hypothetical protein
MTALKVDGSAVTQPVSGTFWQATQPVSIAGTVTVSGALTDTQLRATAVPVSGTFWQATQPVSAASLPLPTGAATSAKQDTIITAVQGATPAGENHIGAVGGNSSIASATFNRPADTTAYVSGDLVANSTTAGSVTPMSLAAARVNQGTGAIRRVRLSTNHTSLAGTEIFRVHLFKTSPTVSNGDNGAFSANGVASVSLGAIDVTLSSVYNDGSKGYVSTDILFAAAAATQNIFGLVEARGGYTPTSGETFTLELEVLQD